MQQEKIKLYGFNNLTKSLSFNIYDVCYAKTQREQKDYIAYIDKQYNSERLTGILTHVAEMIGAKVLHISSQDYDPQGASVTLKVLCCLWATPPWPIWTKATSRCTLTRNITRKPAWPPFGWTSTWPHAAKLPRFPRWII